MFAGFDEWELDVSEAVRIHGRSGGAGPAIVLLHGHPRAHTTWHLVQHERVDARFATEWWHWFFFAGSPHAERVINADPDAWYGLDEDKKAAMGEENFAYVAGALHDPLTVRAMLEDYRAGLGIDVEHDRDDLARGRTISCPTLVAWSIHDDMEDLYGDLVPLWQPWISAPVTRARIDSGHHMAEENPEQLAAVISAFRRGLSSVGAPTP